jgi:hypothetical protein
MEVEGFMGRFHRLPKSPSLCDAARRGQTGASFTELAASRTRQQAVNGGIPLGQPRGAQANRRRNRLAVKRSCGGLFAFLASLGAGSGSRFGFALGQLTAGGGQLGTRLFQVALVTRILPPDIHQLP